MVNSMVKEGKHGMMAVSMRENTKMAKKKDLEFICGMMGANILVIGMRIK